MQARVVAVQKIHLGLLDRFYHLLRDELDIVVYTCQMLGSIEYQSCTGTKQSRSLGGYDCSVIELHCGCRNSGLLLTLLGGNRCTTCGCGYTGLVHEKGYAVYLNLIGLATGHIAQSGIVSAYHLILGATAADLIIADAEAGHIHTHIGG